MFQRVWFAFKLLLSAALVAAPIVFFVAAPRAIFDPAFVAVSAVMLFFAALPWVDFAAPNRAFALAGMVFSMGMAFLAGQTAFGSVQFPRLCTGRRAAFCEMENMLFLVGGKYLAAMPFAVLAGLIFVGSAGMLLRVIQRRQ